MSSQRIDERFRQKPRELEDMASRALKRTRQQQEAALRNHRADETDVNLIERLDNRKLTHRSDVVEPSMMLEKDMGSQQIG